ncbi:MAG: pyruvate kinase [Candidatus Cloacimonadota bacterium]|nr:MAG: pyruvate kinase [Candidatus Cloacimonadota bacterium]
MRKTKIVATVGPACSSEESLKLLMNKGVNVFRLNMSHGEHEIVEGLITMIRSLNKELKKNVGILMDLQGPKVRVGKFENDQIELENGQIFTFDQNEELGTNERVSTTYPTIYQDVKRGDQILLDDGKMEVRVLEVSGTSVITKVIQGGILKNKKGMNLPEVTIGLPAITDKDMADLKFGVEHDIDYIALSFVQRYQDVVYLRNILKMHKREDIGIISKIEKLGAVEDLERIAKLSDAVMVARGDLGVEISPEKVPNVQKRIISICNRLGKPVITATQMLDSMENSPKPTRAEASDVANAILDGTDAVMLSGETAAGNFPAESVEMMRKIIIETEKEMGYDIRPFTYFDFDGGLDQEAISYSTCQIAKAVNANLICCFTSAGKQALRVSKFRPQHPIIAVTYTEKTANKVSLYWGVVPIVLKESSSNTLDDEIIEADHKLIDKKWALEGDKLIITAGIPLHISGSTNAIKIHSVCDETTLESSYR